MPGGINMPRRDGTGPTGQGSMNGRGLGARGGIITPSPAYGRGVESGRGRSMGCRRLGGFRGPISYSKEELVAQKKILQRELDLIESELQDVSNSK